MKLQFEDLIDCLQIAFPNHNIVALFDQSAGHTAKREEGLDATNMNVLSILDLTIIKFV
jgi:hypothetical protein